MLLFVASFVHLAIVIIRKTSQYYSDGRGSFTYIWAAVQKYWSIFGYLQYAAVVARQAFYFIVPTDSSSGVEGCCSPIRCVEVGAKTNEDIHDNFVIIFREQSVADSMRDYPVAQRDLRERFQYYICLQCRFNWFHICVCCGGNELV